MQPLRGVPRKTCSEIMQQIYRRTPMLKCEITLRRGCFPVNVLYIVRTPFVKTPLVGCFCNFQVYHIPLCSYLPYLPYFILQAEIFSLSTDKLIPQRSSHRRCSVKKSVLFKRNDSGTDVFL